VTEVVRVVWVVNSVVGRTGGMALVVLVDATTAMLEVVVELEKNAAVVEEVAAVGVRVSITVDVDTKTPVVVSDDDPKTKNKMAVDLKRQKVSHIHRSRNCILGYNIHHRD
jgi:hypothetical protein